MHTISITHKQGVKHRHSHVCTLSTCPCLKTTNRHTKTPPPSVVSQSQYKFFQHLPKESQLLDSIEVWQKHTKEVYTMNKALYLQDKGTGHVMIEVYKATVTMQA